MNGSAEPQVSVIVPTHREPGGLDATLAALREQTVSADRFEVIVVNHDPSNPIAPESRGLRLQITDESRAGAYAAFNTGVDLSTGAILAFTEAGCRPAPDWLEHALVQLDDDGSADTIAGAIRTVFVGDGRPTLTARYDMARGFPIERHVAQFGTGAAPNLVVRRAAFDRAGPFDASLVSGGDGEWCRRLGAAGGRLVFGPDVIVEYPARTSLSVLVDKARQAARSRHDKLAEEGRARDYLRGSVVRDALPPVKSALDIVRTVGPMKAAPLVGIELLLNYARLFERLRLLVRRGG